MPEIKVSPKALKLTYADYKTEYRYDQLSQRRIKAIIGGILERTGGKFDIKVPGEQLSELDRFLWDAYCAHVDR